MAKILKKNFSNDYYNLNSIYLEKLSYKYKNNDIIFYKILLDEKNKYDYFIKITRDKNILLDVNINDCNLEFYKLNEDKYEETKLLNLLSNSKFSLSLVDLKPKTGTYFKN